MAEIICIDGKLNIPKELFDSSKGTNPNKIESKFKSPGGLNQPYTVEIMKSLILSCSGFELPSNIPVSLLYEFFPHMIPDEVEMKKSKKTLQKELDKKMKDLKKFMKSFEIGCFEAVYTLVYSGLNSLVSS